MRQRRPSELVLRQSEQRVVILIDRPDEVLGHSVGELELQVVFVDVKIQSDRGALVPLLIVIGILGLPPEHHLE